MKRKVAAKGRQGREFSWSMSVKTGRKGIPEASKRRKRADTADVRLAPRKTCHSPEFVPSRCCWAGANSVFSEKAGNTRSSVEGGVPTLQIAGCAGAVPYYYIGAGTDK